MSDAYPSMLSDLIRQLQAILDRDGDMPVAAPGSEYRTAAVYAYVEPSYYDGGYIMPAERTGEHCRAWTHSTVAKSHPRYVRLRTGEPEPWYEGDPAGDWDTIDGVPVKAKWDVPVFALPPQAAKGDMVDCPTCGAQWQNYGHPEAYWMADGHEG